MVLDRYIRGSHSTLEAKKKWRSWRSTWLESFTKHKPFNFYRKPFSDNMANPKYESFILLLISIQRNQPFYVEPEPIAVQFIQDRPWIAFLHSTYHFKNQPIVSQKQRILLLVSQIHLKSSKTSILFITSLSTFNF